MELQIIRHRLLYWLFGKSTFLSEGLTSALTQSQSIQRKADGTYEAKLPTPGANNDGSGIVFNGITISVPALQYNEGDNFPLRLQPKRQLQAI